MRFFSFFLSIILVTTFVYPQIEYTDQLLDNTVLNSATDAEKLRKPFIRQWVFFEERAYPFNDIPEGAYRKAYEQREELREKNKTNALNLIWENLGPTPGFYFNYSNISSRIVTGAYHPTNPSIMYIGTANGGVWKTTDGGINWFPLTDDMPSLSMGSLEIDPDNPDIIYAGTGEATYSGASYYGRGLLKSTNAGQTWRHITEGLPERSYSSRIKIRPGRGNELLAALGNGGLRKSTDSGNSWFTVLTGRVDDVKFTPSGDTVFAVGSGIGFRRSIDGGVTFSNFGSGLPSGQRTHFDLSYSSPNIMYAAVYASSSVSAYKSTNNGANWFQLVPSQDFLGSQAWYDLYCKVHPRNPDWVYIGTIDIFRSTNGGSSFSNITFGYQGGNVHVDQHFLFFHPWDDNTFISLNDGGINRTINNGNSFTNLNTNLTLTQFYRIAASPFDPRRILGGTQDNGTQETRGAINWVAAFGGDGGEVCFNPFNQNFILGETQNGGLRRTTNGGNTWVSAMSGIVTSENVAWVAPIIAHPNISGTFYVARQRVYRSTNNGGSWTAVSGNVNGTTAVRELAISKSNPSIMYATSSNRVFRSTDEGATWSNVTRTLPGRTITSVNIHPDSSNIAYVTMSGFDTEKVFRTINDGLTWLSIHSDLPDSPVNDLLIYPDDPNSTYFAATDIGIFVTTDAGLTWVESFSGLPNTVMMHLDYSPSIRTLRIGTHGRGVFEASIDQIVPVEFVTFTSETDGNKINLRWTTATELNNRGFEIERKFEGEDWELISFISGRGTTTEPVNYNYEDSFTELNYSGVVSYRLKQYDFDGTYSYSQTISTLFEFVPSDYVLHQNYPNPFNPYTTISYGLAEESVVKLTIVNTIGEIVAVIVNGIQKGGVYEAVWNAGPLPSGTYFYTLEASSLKTNKKFKETKKTVFMK